MKVSSFFWKTKRQVWVYRQVLCSSWCEPCGVKSSLTTQWWSLPVVVQLTVIMRRGEVESSCSLVLTCISKGLGEGREERERRSERERAVWKQCEVLGAFQPFILSRGHPVCILTPCSLYVMEQRTENIITSDQSCTQSGLVIIKAVCWSDINWIPEVYCVFV